MIFWYANWLRESSFSTRMTQANTGMTTIPLEEKNWEEWQQMQLYKAHLCCGDGSQSKKLCFQWRERKAGTEAGQHRIGWGCSCWRLQSWADISKNEMGFIWSFPPCRVRLCLGGHETWLNMYPPSPDSEKSWGMWARAAGSQSRSEQGLLLFAMDLKENISCMSLLCLVSAVLVPGEDWRFLPPLWSCPSCPTLAAVHLSVVFAGTWSPQPGIQQPMHPCPLIFYCLTHPKASGSPLKPAISPYFYNCC